ncbi:Gfo/Idh/MocA family protein [Halalkalibacter kiskunsagensis]|uniref:Gfo/Idh/MocA family protein n=1 Tax=Halalkalibacter kiskunsagensis TaxID=1548599 RepID=A0ABV6KFP6_9BACI
MVRIAVVGTGWHGQGHLNTMKEMALIEIVGICDVNQEMLTKAANKFNVPAFKNYIQMLEETKPEGVVIVTPPKARVELVRDAAIRGIHCFIEKPPAKSIDMAKQISEILNETKVINSVGFMFRYSKAVAKCREVLSGRDVSIIRSAMLDGIALRENWPGWFFIKDISGGPIFDQAIHIFDLSRYLVGDVAQVTGFQGNQVKQQSDTFTIEDSFSLALRYQDGGPLQTHNHSWVYPGFMCQLEFISDSMHLTLDIHKGSISGHVDEEAISYQAEDSLYEQELEAFARAILNNQPELVLSTYDDSLKSLNVTIAMLEALETGTVANVPTT